jgi:hypothetical protein
MQSIELPKDNHMPDFARINGEVRCPACGTKVWDHIRCQWGVLPLSAYAVGDPVSWLRDAQGFTVPPYTLTDLVPNVSQWNCGDPQYENVILFDLDIYAAGGKFSCLACEAGIAAGVVVVKQGIFQELVALDDAKVDCILGASRGRADIVIVREDGTYWPRDDWFDRPIEYRPTRR